MHDHVLMEQPKLKIDKKCFELMFWEFFVGHISQKKKLCFTQEILLTSFF